MPLREGGFWISDIVLLCQLSDRRQGASRIRICSPPCPPRPYLLNREHEVDYLSGPRVVAEPLTSSTRPPSPRKPPQVRNQPPTAWTLYAEIDSRVSTAQLPVSRRKSSIPVLPSRLVHDSKSRQRLREPLLAGFGLLHGRFTLGRHYAARGSRPRREAARAVSSDRARLFGNLFAPGLRHVEAGVLEEDSRPVRVGLELVDRLRIDDRDGLPRVCEPSWRFAFQHWQHTTIPSKPALGFGGARNVWRWGEDGSSGRSAKGSSRATRRPALPSATPPYPRLVFRGTSLRPVPPGASKEKNTRVNPSWRYLDSDLAWRPRATFLRTKMGFKSFW